MLHGYVGIRGKDFIQKNLNEGRSYVFLILKGNDEEGGGLPPKCLGKHASSTCFFWREYWWQLTNKLNEHRSKGVVSSLYPP